MASDEAAGDGSPDPAIDNRHLRSALEYVVTITAETSKRKPSMEFPTQLKPYLKATRLPTKALGRVRRAIESDDTFRERVATGAIPELVDEIGRLWLQRPEGWTADIQAAIAAADDEAATVEARQALRRAEKRREAAEQATRRAVAEQVRLDAALDVAREEVRASAAQRADDAETIERLRQELVEARTQARHARDRERASADRLAETRRRLADAEQILDERTPDVEEGAGTGGSTADPDDGQLDRERLAALRSEVELAIERATSMTAELRGAIADAGADVDRARVSAPDALPPGALVPSRRVPMSLPGGVSAASTEAARHLLRSGANVLVDGYNVAMPGWPTLDLCDQRTALIEACENLSRRFGSPMSIVFDGATVVGGHAPRRRLVRVVYSPEGVTADDVIREEVARLDPSTPVVVVTDDRQIVRDVKAVGANVIPSSTFVEVL